jgi:hypothetical protein
VNLRARSRDNQQTRAECPKPSARSPTTKETTMPIFMKYDGIDGDVASLVRDGGDTSTPPIGWKFSNLKVSFEPAHAKESASFAQGETLVHIEAPVGDSGVDDLLFGGDDSAAGDVELLVKVLNDQGAMPVHVSLSSWLLE